MYAGLAFKEVIIKEFAKHKIVVDEINFLQMGTKGYGVMVIDGEKFSVMSYSLIQRNHPFVVEDANKIVKAYLDYLKKIAKEMIDVQKEFNDMLELERLHSDMLLYKSGYYSRSKQQNKEKRNGKELKKYSGDNNGGDSCINKKSRRWE